MNDYQTEEDMIKEIDDLEKQNGMYKATIDELINYITNCDYISQAVLFEILGGVEK